MGKITELGELLLIVVLVVACHATKNTNTVLPAFDKEGHRGCRGLMPENTIPAMLKALDLGVTTLEMDASITQDKQVILSHEPFFNHKITTKPDGQLVTPSEEHNLNIYRMAYAETQRYDVGLKPHPDFPRQQRLKATKPLLSAVIDSVEAAVRAKKIKPVFYNIETKCRKDYDNIYHPAPDEFVELLMKVIREKGIEDRVIIQSFDFRTLKVLHAKYPQIKTAALIEEYDKKKLEAHLEELGFIPTIYSPAHSLVNKQLVDECHQQKIKVIPWTVNNAQKIQELKSMGVDGIITDYPDLF